MPVRVSPGATDLSGQWSTLTDCIVARLGCTCNRRTLLHTRFWWETDEKQDRTLAAGHAQKVESIPVFFNIGPPAAASALPPPRRRGMDSSKRIADADLLLSTSNALASAAKRENELVVTRRQGLQNGRRRDSLHAQPPPAVLQHPLLAVLLPLLAVEEFHLRSTITGECM